jgi:hypothetical protein
MSASVCLTVNSVSSSTGAGFLIQRIVSAWKHVTRSPPPSAYQDIKNHRDVIDEHRPFDFVIKDGDTRRRSRSCGLTPPKHLGFLPPVNMGEPR